MAAEVAGIAFELTYDGSKMMESINASCKKLRDSFAKSFTDAGKASAKAVATSNAEIQAILDDATKSAKAKAASIAAIYKKEGYDAREAFKKAWSHIERESKDSVKKIRKDTKAGAKGIKDDMDGMAKKAHVTATEIKSNFSSSFATIAKKAAVTLAAAFSIKKLVDFGKECVELGSDLAEVQNVVDVTFPAMTKQVDAFAKSAAASFGLSETMAKQFTGTFGAMAKAFGFSEKEAYDMSTALTGLAGDVASFYNISQDAAYTKLKSVFTGETESLKDLGVVMTQTALDSFALSNGFGKTTKSMSEAEKVALRYAFVQKQLSAAAGDFSRTSDGWANQVRILNLQFDSLKAAIGQGLINVLTPVIKVINSLIGRLMTLANAFKSFTEMLTGNKGGGDATAQLQATAAAADSVAASAEGIGNAAAAAAKKMKALYAFDDMNVANSDSESGGADGGSGVGGYSADTFDMGSVPSDIDKVDSKYQKLIDKAKELADVFRSGFESGLGDTGILDQIGLSLGNIKNRFVEIFTDQDVLTAAERDINTFVENLGLKIGSLVSIGLSVADNLFGGLENYLEGNSDRIKDYLVDLFDIDARQSEIYGQLYSSLAVVFESLRSEGAVRITSALIGIFTDAFLGVDILSRQLSLDLLDTITTPFINNRDQIKAALEETFGAVAPVFESVKSLVDETVGSLMAVYEEHIHPMFMSFRDGFTEIAAMILDAYQEYLLPFIEGVTEKTTILVENHLKPFLNTVSDLIVSIADGIKALWENILKPLVEWVIENILPVLIPILDAIYSTFLEVTGYIIDALAGFIERLKGIIDFIVGIFTGDWEKAWNGIGDIVTGIMDVIGGVINTSLSLFKGRIDIGLTAISGIVRAVSSGIVSFVRMVLNTISNVITLVVGGIKNGISNTLNAIKTKWIDIWTSIKITTTNIFKSLWNGIKGVINSILSGVETMANGVITGINNMIRALNNLHIEIPDWVPAVGGSSFGFNIPEIGQVHIPRLKDGGYVKANTPQLAMIGDNLHHGEIVAPEDKIYQISTQAMRDVMKELLTEVHALISMAGRDRTIVIKVSGEMAPFIRLIKAELDKEANREGINFEVVYE